MSYPGLLAGAGFTMERRIGDALDPPLVPVDYEARLAALLDRSVFHDEAGAMGRAWSTWQHLPRIGRRQSQRFGALSALALRRPRAALSRGAGPRRFGARAGDGVGRSGRGASSNITLPSTRRGVDRGRGPVVRRLAPLRSTPRDSSPPCRRGIADRRTRCRRSRSAARGDPSARGATS